MLAVTGMLTGLTNCDGMWIHSQAVDDNQRLSTSESAHDERSLHLPTTRDNMHPSDGLFSRTTWVSQYQKGKTSLD